MVDVFRGPTGSGRSRDACSPAGWGRRSAHRSMSLLDGVALARPPVAKSPPLEQDIDHGVRITTENGVEIVVPPVYHEIVTAG